MKSTAVKSIRGLSVPRLSHLSVSDGGAVRTGYVAERQPLCDFPGKPRVDAQRLPVGVGLHSGHAEHVLHKRNALGPWKLNPGRGRRSALAKPNQTYASALTYGSAGLARSASKGSAPIRVLVVEDAGDVRRAAADVLVRHGMVVRKASSPDNLIHDLHRFKPDVVVLDDYFRQSKIGFADLMPSLVERFPGVRYVVTLSGSPTASLDTDPLRWGASDVVYKDTMFRDRTLERSVINVARG